MRYRMYHRTIRNNRVQIRGKTLGCAELQNGELDGVRCSFLPYSDFGDESGFAHDGLTALWGTERYYRSTLRGEASLGAAMKDTEILAPDGTYKWYVWREVKE